MFRKETGLYSRKRSLVPALVLWAGVPAWAQSPADFTAVEAQLKACNLRNADIPGASQCEAAAQAQADRQLNQVYTGVVNALKHPGPSSAPYDPEVVQRLVAAERAWIVFRDAECSYQSSVALHAPLEGFEWMACRYAQRKARVKALTAPEAPQNAR